MSDRILSKVSQRLQWRHCNLTVDRPYRNE